MILVALGSTVASAAAGGTLTEITNPALPSCYRVDEHLYRGAQPQPGGMTALRELGIRTVVNLRYEPKLIGAEEAEAKAAGLDYVSIPMYGLLRPTDDQISRILALIDDPKSGPVFVHCEHGHDRTGVVVACYRVARARWTASEAIREALDYGMLKIEFAKRAFIRDYYDRFVRGLATATR